MQQAQRRRSEGADYILTILDTGFRASTVITRGVGKRKLLREERLDEYEQSDISFFLMFPFEMYEEFYRVQMYSFGAPMLSDEVWSLSLPLPG